VIVFPSTPPRRKGFQSTPSLAKKILSIECIRETGVPSLVLSELFGSASDQISLARKKFFNAALSAALDLHASKTAFQGAFNVGAGVKSEGGLS
jgi:hypothetical protein